MSGVLICVTRSHEITFYFVLVSLKRLETRKQEDQQLTATGDVELTIFFRDPLLISL